MLSASASEYSVLWLEKATPGEEAERCVDNVAVRTALLSSVDGAPVEFEEVSGWCTAARRGQGRGDCKEPRWRRRINPAGRATGEAKREGRACQRIKAALETGDWSWRLGRSFGCAQAAEPIDDRIRLCWWYFWDELPVYPGLGQRVVGLRSCRLSGKRQDLSAATRSLAGCHASVASCRS